MSTRPASPNDPCIIAAKRTPLCRASRGSLASVPPSTLLSCALDGVLSSVSDASGASVYFDGSLVQDVCVGNVLAPASGAAMCRMAQLSTRSARGGGLDASVPLRTVNRQCASGLQAVADVCYAIASGSISCGIGAGVESMSFHPMKNIPPPDVDWEAMGPPSAGESPRNEAMDCLIPMGITSDNVCAEYGLDRATLDAYAVRSHARAQAAATSGKFRAEIVPVGDVDCDDGIRAGSTMEGLSKLRPVFTKSGLTTAGNASQMTDGAAAVLIMSRSEANRRGLRILAVFRGFHACGVPPHLMGIGPAVAIPRVLSVYGLAVDDVDVYEINEAFASQATHCIDEIGIRESEATAVNPSGGAIALGHPLGCTGARMVATLVHELHRRREAWAGGGTRSWRGVVSMCVGTGMGAAAILEVEGAMTSKL